MSDSVVLPEENLKTVRASSEARRKRILANADARLQAIAGGLKPPRGQPPDKVVETTDEPRPCPYERVSANARTSPDSFINRTDDSPGSKVKDRPKSTIPATQELETERSAGLGRLDFHVMLFLGLFTRLAAHSLNLNLFGPFALFALPLLFLTAPRAISSGIPNLHGVLLEALISSGRPVIRRASVGLAFARTVFEYFAAYLFSFVLVHVFIEEFVVA